jgi:FMN phosphatase YigB (HAD superfamily)
MSHSYKKIFIFDLDDTLIISQNAYSLSFLKFYNLLKKIFKKRIPFIGYLANLVEDINKILIFETDPLTGKSYRFSSRRYPIALVKTYEFLCNEGFGKYDNNIAEEIYKIGLNTFDPKNYHLIPYSKKILNFLLKNNFYLILVTLGEKEIQNSKILKFNFHKIFHEIHIEEENKNEKFKFLREKFFDSKIISIGNSYKHDIIPSFESNIDLIFWFKNITWKGDEVEEVKEYENLIKIHSLKEIPYILKKFF